MGGSRLLVIHATVSVAVVVLRSAFLLLLLVSGTLAIIPSLP